MAIQNVSDSQKIDYLWKKLGYGASKTDISGNIDATQEPYASPLQIRADKIMQQSALIPSVIPGSNTSVVSVYTTSLPIQCISNAGIPTPTLTWLTGVTYWIPPEFGSTYQVKVYIAPAGNAAAVLTRGTQVFATGSGNNDEWFFDYQSGILQFNGNNTPYNASNQPISFTGNAVYISGAVYSGAFGLPSTIGNLTVSNTTIISPGNISFSSNSGYIYAGGAIIANVANPVNSQDVVTVANLLSTVGNISAITGNLTVGGNLVVTGNLVVLGNLTQMNIEVINTTEYISSTGNLVINNTAPSTSTTTGVITTLGGIGIGGNINAGGNISAPYFIGSGQFITGLPVAYSNVNVKAYTESMGFQNFGNANVIAYTQTQGYTNYSNTNVIAYTQTQAFSNYSNINLTAYLGGNITVGNISATYFAGSGALLTSLPGYAYSNVNVKAYTETMGFQNFGNANVIAYTQTQGYTNYSNINVASYINTMGYNNYSNVNVAAYTQSQAYSNYSNINVQAYLAGNITTGNITAPYFVGSGALLTSLPGYAYSNVNVKAYTETMGFQNFGNVNVIAYTQTMSFTNYSNVNVKAYTEAMGFTNYGNANVISYLAGNISVGNISATYFAGSGALLTALPGYAYSNVNIAAYTQTMGYTNYSNVNVAAYTQTQSFTNYSNVNTKAYTESMGFQNFGNVNVVAYTQTMSFTNYSNVNVKAYTEAMGFQNYGNVNVKAYTETMGFTNYSNVNVSAYLPGYLSSYNGTGYFSSVSASGNVTIGGNLVVYGNITALGNITQILTTITGNTGQFFGNTQGFGALYAGVSSGYIFEPQTILQLSSNYNGYAQLNLQNINSGANASGDLVVTMDTGNTSQGYIDLGINSSQFVGGAGNELNYPGDGYLYVQGNVGGPGGNLLLSTNLPGDIVFSVGGAGTANEVGRFIYATKSFKVSGNINATGNVLATSFVGSGALLTNLPGYAYSNVNIAAYTQTMGYTNYSNVNVASYINSMGYVNYSNVNVKAYTESMGFTNYSNVNLTAYLAGNITTGNISAPYFIGSGQFLTVLPGYAYSNVNVAAYSQTQGYTNYSNVNVKAYTETMGFTNYSNVNVVSYLAGNITVGNISSTYFVGSGALLTALPGYAYSNVNVKAYTETMGFQNFGNVNVAAYSQTQGYSNYSNVNVASYLASQNIGTTNYSNVNTKAYTETMGFQNYGNVNVNAYLSGNVTVGNLVSNGSVTATTYLGTGVNTSIIAGSYTSVFTNTGNVILPNVYVGGNVTAGYFVGNGSQLTGIPAGYSNVQTAAYLNTQGYNLYSNVNVIAYLAGNITVGNITAGYFTGNGAFLTGLPAGYSNVQLASYLPGYNGAIGASNVTISGNLVLNSTSNILIAGNAGLNGQFLTSTGNGVQWSSITISASQISSGASNVTVTANYVNVAVNGSNVASFNSTGLNVSAITATPGANIKLTASSGGIVQITGNAAMGIPYGNTYTRPGNPTTGYLRYNTDIPALETWTGTSWAAPGTATVLSQMIYPDGVANTFTLTTSTSTNAVIVSINGTIQQPMNSYNVANTSITFSEVPLTSDQIEVRYLLQGTSVVSASQLQFGNTTSVVLDAANITVTSQNINQSGNLAVQGNITYGTLQSGVTTIPTSANVIYVAKNGNDSWNGTINAPFLTIKAGLAAAANITSSTGVSVQVAPGYYTEANPITIPPKVSLMGDNLRNVTVVPQTPTADLFYVTNGCYVWGITIKDYLANGFSYNSSTSSQNVFVSPYIQNLTSSTTTGTAVMVDGAFTSNASTKAMIVGFFTIINQGGVGVRLQNSAYSQLVNIYTIAANVGVWAQSGSFCTLNGSDNSIGNIGLRADGYGPLLSTGQTVGYSINGQFVLNNLTQPPHVNQVMLINGDSNFYSIDTITKIDNLTYQVNIQEVYSGNLAPSSNISFYQRSQVVASAHTFEYVGAGTVPANALPQYGGLPDATKNVVMTNGGRVTYTATDEKGNFFIGSNLVINQGTGTISGDSFNRSLFQIMTPYILALEGTI